MNGFKKVTGKRAGWLIIHEGVREQLRSALIERHHGIAAQMIAREVLAALKRDGPRFSTFQVRFLHQQAQGMETEQRSTTRVAFLLRQLKRNEEKLHEQD
jgi:hypothetical protein